MDNATPTSSSSSMFMRFQKKVVSKISNKNTVKLFMGETAKRCIDNLSLLILLHNGGLKKQADSITNDTIKIIMKIGLLYANNQLSESEVELLESTLVDMGSLARTVITFHEDKKAYNNKRLSDLLQSCHNKICALIRDHLTDNSKARVDNVFGCFNNLSFLDDVFKIRKYENVMPVLVQDLRKLLDDGLQPNSLKVIYIVNFILMLLY